MPKQIVPNLWFDTEAEEAAEFYCSVFPNSRIRTVTRYPEGAPREAGMVMTVDFELDGQRFTAINGGPDFKFDEAVSFLVECSDQEELDRYWDALLAGGGSESQCGWLRDRFGLSWQVGPAGFEEFFSNADSEQAARAMQAMLGMVKIDIAELEAAAAGERAEEG